MVFVGKNLGQCAITCKRGPRLEEPSKSKRVREAVQFLFERVEMILLMRELSNLNRGLGWRMLRLISLDDELHW